MPAKITGLTEQIQALKTASEKLPDALGISLASGLENIADKMREYGPQRPPSNPNYLYIRGSGTMYVPTGHISYTSEQYGDNISVTTDSNPSYQALVAGRIVQSASYASFVRGDIPNTPPMNQAWMHAGYWETNDDITNAEMEYLIPLLQDTVDSLFSY